MSGTGTAALPKPLAVPHLETARRTAGGAR